MKSHEIHGAYIVQALKIARARKSNKKKGGLKMVILGFIAIVVAGYLFCDIQGIF